MAPSLAFALLLAVSLASGDKTATEQSISLTSFFEDLNTKFQNATHVVENILGVDIPSTQAEVKTALEDNLSKLKSNAEYLQKKLGEYNGTSSLTEVLQQVQNQVNKTVEDLGKRNPDAGKLLDQVKVGYNNLLDVSKRVQDVVEQQAGSASQDLKALAQQARSELSRAASQLETKVQEVLADSSKKS